MSPKGPLALPAELRLDIYRYIVADVLAGGSSSDLFGLYISCHEIHHELEHELISKVRPFLSVQSRWKNAIRSQGYTQRIPLRLKPTYQGIGPNALLTELHIALPGLEEFSPRIEGAGNTLALATLFRILRPLLQGSCPTLTITLLQITEEHILDFYAAVGMYNDLVKALRSTAHGTTGYFEHTKRLIFNYVGQEDSADQVHFDELISGFQTSYMAPEKRIIPLPLQSWIVRDQRGPQDERGWKVVHDFEERAQDLEGDVWKIEREGLYIKAMTLSAPYEESGWETDYEAMDPVIEDDSD